MGSNVYVADIGELIVLEFAPEGEPSLPTLPQSPHPTDGAMFYQSETTLSWGPPATHCDPLSYDLYLGNQNPPLLVASDLLSPTFHTSNLERRQTYFWRVVAHDRQGDETVGPLWQFHVRTNAQPPPAPTPAPRPELPPPEQDSVLLLIGGLMAGGAIMGVLWWVRARRKEIY